MSVAIMFCSSIAHHVQRLLAVSHTVDLTCGSDFELLTITMYRVEIDYSTMGTASYCRSRLQQYSSRILVSSRAGDYKQETSKYRAP